MQGADRAGAAWRGSLLRHHHLARPAPTSRRAPPSPCPAPGGDQVPTGGVPRPRQRDTDHRHLPRHRWVLGASRGLAAPGRRRQRRHLLHPPALARPRACLVPRPQRAATCACGCPIWRARAAWTPWSSASRRWQWVWRGDPGLASGCVRCGAGAAGCPLLSHTPPAAPPLPQGDRLSLAGTQWTRLTNAWGARWELRCGGRQGGGGGQQQDQLARGVCGTAMAGAWGCLPTRRCLAFQTPCRSGLPDPPLDLRITSDGQELVARYGVTGQGR